MSPVDVWVIYNKYTKEVVWVGAEYFLADRESNRLKEEAVQPGFKQNKDKLVVCTLQRALDEIADEHRHEISYLKEEYDQASKWQTT